MFVPVSMATRVHYCTLEVLHYIFLPVLDGCGLVNEGVWLIFAGGAKEGRV